MAQQQVAGSRDEPIRSIARLIDAGRRSFSFEFFPPKTPEGEEQLWTAIRDLEPYHPTFVSVTYGAGGSTRDSTVQITGRIARETTMEPLGHLTCVDHSVAELTGILQSYGEAGVRNVLALRGDPPGGPGQPWQVAPGGLRYASELVALARSAGDFCVGVAAFALGHREAATPADDARVLLAKQQAGAEFAITDMFFRVEDYVALRERAQAAGVHIPILAGIMPITNLRQVSRMAELSGREVPAEVVARIARHEGDPVALRAAGIEVAADLCQALLDDGVPGLHFYTLNRSRATLEIFEHLNITV
jgi:methylenetetrahydrofolate reductase (NADPH)